MFRLLPLLLLASACFEDTKSSNTDGEDSAGPTDSDNPGQEDTGASGDSGDSARPDDSGGPDDTGPVEDTGSEPAPACTPTRYLPDGLILNDTNAPDLCASGDIISATRVAVGQNYTGTDLSPLSCVCEATPARPWQPGRHGGP